MGKKLDNDFFETIIVYNLLTDQTYLGTLVDIIKPEYFKDKNVSHIIGIIGDFFQARGQAPTLTEIKTQLTSDDLRATFKEVVEQFSGIDKKYNRDELYENTERFLKEKAVFCTMMDVADDCNKGSIDTGKILEQFESACGINLSGSLGLEFFSDIDIHIEDLRKQEKYIPSTWDWLDRKLGGGFLETGRAMYLFAGQTNVGKSIFLGNIATNVAAQNKTVLLVTLEMSELMYAKRLSSNITKVPMSDLSLSSDLVKQRVVDYKTTRPESKLIVKEFPPNAITVNQLSSYIQKLVNRGTVPDMIVIDYVNLFHSTVGINSYERIKNVSEQLRALTYTFNCPIVTATQINRSGFNESNPGVENISESIGLAATADCIMSIWQDEGDVDLGVIRMGMMKNRYGQNFGSIAMAIDYTTLGLSEAQNLINTEEAEDMDQLFGALGEDEL
tara:strand:+ start:80 stop:1414 length:1335 start_codon:yes stop_codon:yes gene_type:complete